MEYLGVLQKLHAQVVDRTLLGLLLGPLTGLVIWGLPLSLDPAAQKALAIVAFMLVYWITEPIDYGITALLGCYLFWAVKATSFSVAFSGFATSTPWFILGVLLIGEAASRTGLAKRIGYMVLRRVGISYSRVLLGMLLLIWLLSFLIPSPNALLATLAPVAVGIVAAFNAGPGSPLATGLFVMLTYMCTIFGKMVLGGGVTVLAAGFIESQTGTQVLWSQWLSAYLPAAVPTVVAAWLTIRWLYPIKQHELAGGNLHLENVVNALGPWSRDEKKALVWLLVTVGLWTTDFLHHTSPATIAIGVGLLLSLPKVGVLDSKAVRQVNFLQIMFIGGALSMGTVLIETQLLNLLTESLVSRVAPLLTNALSASIVLYWTNFLYHFLLGNEFTLISAALPLLLKLGEAQGYNVVALGMMWAFAGGGKLFAYQNSALVVGLSYGYFTGRDLLKVGAVMTLVEGLVLMVLVPLYWPLIGLPWRTMPPSQLQAFTVSDVSVQEQSGRPSHPSVQPLQRETLLPPIGQHTPSRGAEDASPSPPDSEGETIASDNPHYPGSTHGMVSPPGTAASGDPLRSVIRAERSERAQVRQAQAQLRQAGFQPGALDGHLGPRTKAALRRYQAVRGLPITGELDEATRKALGL